MAARARALKITLMYAKWRQNHIISRVYRTFVSVVASLSIFAIVRSRLLRHPLSLPHLPPESNSRFRRTISPSDFPLSFLEFHALLARLIKKTPGSKISARTSMSFPSYSYRHSDMAVRLSRRYTRTSSGHVNTRVHNPRRLSQTLRD